MARRDTFFARNIFTAFFAGLALLTLPHLAHAIPTTATLDASGISWVISGSVSFDTDDLGDSPLPVTSSSFEFDFGSGAVSLTPVVIDSSPYGFEIVFLQVFSSSPYGRILLFTAPQVWLWSIRSGTRTLPVRFSPRSATTLRPHAQAPPPPPAHFH